MLTIFHHHINLVQLAAMDNPSQLNDIRMLNFQKQRKFTERCNGKTFLLLLMVNLHSLDRTDLLGLFMLSLVDDAVRAFIDFTQIIIMLVNLYTAAQEVELRLLKSALLAYHLIHFY